MEDKEIYFEIQIQQKKEERLMVEVSHWQQAIKRMSSTQIFKFLVKFFYIDP